MRHDLTIAGPAFRLRPVTDVDAPFVLELRGNSKLNRYLHPITQCLNDQLDWLTRYYDRLHDYYFIVERQDSGGAEGLISIYDIDSQAACGEWGRWILKPRSLAAAESALLIYRCAFEKLALERVVCRTVADNAPVVSFHDSCGITTKRLLPGYFDLNGIRVDAIEHQVSTRTWNEISPKLELMAQRTARILRRG